MTTWRDISIIKRGLNGRKRDISNFYKYISVDYIYSGVYEPTDNKIQTLNTAVIEYFFDLYGDYKPTENKNCWYTEYEDNYISEYQRETNYKPEIKYFQSTPITKTYLEMIKTPEIRKEPLKEKELKRDVLIIKIPKFQRVK